MAYVLDVDSLHKQMMQRIQKNQGRWTTEDQIWLINQADAAAVSAASDEEIGTAWYEVGASKHDRCIAFLESLVKTMDFPWDCAYSMDDITPDMALNIIRYDKLMPQEYINEVTPDAVYSSDAKFDTRHKTLLNTLLVYRDEGIEWTQESQDALDKEIDLCLQDMKLIDTYASGWKEYADEKQADLVKYESQGDDGGAEYAQDMYNCSMVSWRNGEELKRSCWMKFFDMVNDAYENVNFDDINVVGVENPGIDMDKIREQFPAQYGAWLRLRDDASAREPKLDEGTYAQVTKDRGRANARAAKAEKFQYEILQSRYTYPKHERGMDIINERIVDEHSFWKPSDQATLEEHFIHKVNALDKIKDEYDKTRDEKLIDTYIEFGREVLDDLDEVFNYHPSYMYYEGTLPIFGIAADEVQSCHDYYEHDVDIMLADKGKIRKDLPSIDEMEDNGIEME
ncbi:MAG: hypothetical protein KH433_00215 [Campylobacter concisus]|nr:hypothetical protein [Campylobacter concisus]